MFELRHAGLYQPGGCPGWWERAHHEFQPHDRENRGQGLEALAEGLRRQVVRYI